MSAINKPITD